MRDELKRLLAAHVPSDEKEAADLEAMQRFAQTLENPFGRDQLPGHFTASALVVDEAMEHVCLVHHKKLNRWLQPGGHFEASDVDVVSAALREAREETGLEVALHPHCLTLFDVDIHVIPERPLEPAHQHLDVRFLVRGVGTLQLAVEESHAVRWFRRDEVEADESVRRMLMKLAAGR